MGANPPQTKKELQSFLEQLSYLRRFISNAAGKTQVFSSLLRLKESEKFVRTQRHQEVFEAIKEYLASS